MLAQTMATKYWCPECKWWTAGIIDQDKRTCPRCRRELWPCLNCHRLTLGTLDDPNLCGECGERRSEAKKPQL